MNAEDLCPSNLQEEKEEECAQSEKLKKQEDYLDYSLLASQNVRQTKRIKALALGLTKENSILSEKSQKMLSDASEASEMHFKKANLIKMLLGILFFLGFVQIFYLLIRTKNPLIFQLIAFSLTLFLISIILIKQ